MPADIAVCFLTHERRVALLRSTLASFFDASGKYPFQAFAISTHNVHPEVAAVAAEYGAKLLTASTPFGGSDARIAAYHNLISALDYGTEVGGYLCVCADDITFRSKFFDLCSTVLSEMHADGLEDFILSAYFSAPLRGFSKKLYRSYPAHSFYSLQCLLLTPSETEGLKEFLESHIHFAHDEPFGLLINRYCRRSGKLFATCRSIVQHSGTQSLCGNPFHQAPTFSIPWPGDEEVEFAKARKEALEATGLGGASGSFAADRGIVICAGGLKYFTCAWVTVRMLRRLGCRLPVELWHLGPEEMTPEMQRLAALLGLKCVDAHEVRKEHPVRTLHGWELKCYAILHSRFREVLLMDADNVPAVNPRYLFDTPEYKETGAVFWPDIGSMGPEKEIWKITGVPYDGKRDFESGQILVDKRRCWKALQLAMHYNEHSDFYYQYIYGDKDTFRFAFLKTGTPFAMPERGIDFLDGTLCQHDFEGRRVFQHRIKKWSLAGKNKPTPGFLHEAECMEYLDELRGLWQTGIPAAVAPKEMLIPRILHRLWLGPEPLSARQERWAESWRKLHPEWEHKVWTAQNLPDLINGPEFAGARDFQQRMEIASYELLHRFGGVWVDADFECLRPLDGLLAGEECVLGEESPGRICHGLLAGVPGHEFFKHLTRSVRNSLRDHAGKPAVEQTGANFVTRHLRDRWDVTVLPPRYFHPHPHAEGTNGKRRSRAAETYAQHHPSPRWVPLPEVVYERRLRQYAPEGKTPRERAAARALTRGVFDYHRMGYDRRRLQFLRDGTFGEGAGGCEKTWDLHEEGGAVTLTIFGPGYVTCRAADCADGAWHGAWLIGEKMPVELTSCA